MRTAFRHATSLVGIAVLAGITLGLLVGTLVGDLRNTLIAIAVLAALAITALAVRSLWLANRKHNQINRDEIDAHREPHTAYSPEDFAMDLRVQPATYDLTIGLLIPGDHKATEDSQSILRRLTRDDLITVIAQHGGSQWQALTPTGRLTLRGGAQLIWQPSTTDTTGETR